MDLCIELSISVKWNVKFVLSEWADSDCSLFHQLLGCIFFLCGQIIDNFLVLSQEVIANQIVLATCRLTLIKVAGSQGISLPTKIQERSICLSWCLGHFTDKHFRSIGYKQELDKSMMTRLAIKFTLRVACRLHCFISGFLTKQDKNLNKNKSFPSGYFLLARE